MAEKCPVPYMHELHEVSVDSPDTTHAITAGLLVAGWHSMPDVIHPRFLRAIFKLALLGGATAYLVHLDDSGKIVPSSVVERAVQLTRTTYSSCPVSQWSEGAQVITLVGSGLVAAKLCSIFNRAVFHRAEKARKRGRHFAHTRQAVVLGGLAGGAVYYLLKK